MNTRILYNSVKNLLLVFFVLFISISCDNFLDINEDPNAATEAPGDFLFSEASAVLQSNRNIEIGPLVSFFVQTYASNASNGGGLFLPQERYIIGPSDFSVTNNFGGIYTSVQNNLALYIQDLQGNEPTRNNAIAQAQLLRDYTFWYLTVLFGDVPFSEANDPNIQNPNFDSQQDILDSLVVRIDESIQLINEDDQTEPITDADLFYNGDMQKWEHFANSLKLRILMLKYNTDPSVASEIQALLDNPNLIRENVDNFEFPYLTESGRENQQFQLADDFSGGEPFFFWAGEELVDAMNADDDPRRALYFDEAPIIDDETGEEVGTQGFIGVPAGADTSDEFSTIGSAVTIPTFPGRILGAAETLLHEAEFLAKEGNFVAARTKLEAGIRASINDVYDNTDSTVTSTEIDVYVADILSDYDVASNEGKIEEIQLQHYIDSFEKVPENWTLWRRTKVPELELPLNATLGSIIRRLPISAEEISANPNAPTEPEALDTPMSFEQ